MAKKNRSSWVFIFSNKRAFMVSCFLWPIKFLIAFDFMKKVRTKHKEISIISFPAKSEVYETIKKDNSIKIISYPIRLPFKVLARAA